MILAMHGVSSIFNKMFPRPLALSICLILLSTITSHAESITPSAPLNELILQAVGSMPSGGGYSTGKIATRAMQEAVKIGDNGLRVEASGAIPSYCSGATYLIFLKVLSTLLSRHELDLSPSVLKSLKPSSQVDGTGLWGRWNANGPGTARLFYELGLGSNFTDISKAIPGDFLKIFWNDGIGVSEHGHSVIYLGTETRDGIACVTFWSSNIPNGFGQRTVPLKRIRRLLFSRLEHPRAIINPLTRTDNYLASLEHRSSTASEMYLKCGVTGQAKCDQYP